MDYTSVSQYPTVEPEKELSKLKKLLLGFEGDLAKINIAYAGNHISLVEYSNRRNKIFKLATRMKNSLDTKVKRNLVFV